MTTFQPVAVTIQPGGVTVDSWPSEWMQPPSHEYVPTNCPPGLEHLAVLPEIFIQQKLSWMEICCGCEANQKYDITHPETGKMLYKAIEDTSCCTRAWCGNARPLQMSVNNHLGNEILHFTRPFHCAGGICCPPCMDEILVTTPDGMSLGSVRQQFAWCVPSLNVLDASGNVIFNIKGPCWHCKCCAEVPFKAKEYLTDDHLYKIMDDMFGAGSETTTTTMRWAFLFFAHWPSVQDKAYESMVEKIGTERLPVIADRQDLPYVDAIVHEVLRMACIAPFAVPHKTTCDTTLGGYNIEKDTQIFFNIWALHFDSREWSDPFTFKPERFMDITGNIVPGAQRSYLPFSAGRRVCLAELLAKVELFLLIARMLHQYKFLPDPDEPLPDLEGIYGLFLAPKPYKIMVTKRNHCCSV